MSTQAKKRTGKRNLVTILAVVLIVAGVLAFAVPLVWQKINYSIAAKKAAEAQAQMVIPDKDDYKPVDYSTMQKGVTPSFSPAEMEEAASPPSFLEELGIVGDPSSMLLGIKVANAESAEPAFMREALNLGAQALKESAKGPYDVNAVNASLAQARKQVENAFFLLTQIQPITNTETLSSLSSQKVVDGLTLGDKTITAAREMIYATLTDLEELLRQVEDLSATVNSSGARAIMEENLLLAQMNTLSSYLTMVALHLPEDDYKSAMAQHRELAALAGQNQKPAENEGEYAAIDKDPEGVKRSYLLEIPDIGVKVAAYRSGSFNKMYENMRIGAAMFPRAPEPNTVANICISAHRTGTRDYFRNLNKLSVGDTIYLHTSHLGSFEYEVVKVDIIDNNDWSVAGDVGYPALTLLSCQAFGGVSNAQRIMVRAKLVGVANGQK
jgi:LPXTG-site transpeptidase (sortase) family protein